ncbi:hypothetical protein JCM9140_297 [Halalkalibacter wakoensis JCM 9140]|uniref:Uncharacterized protein n=1 Tax=Halalkalibacter wakoensis JCM 9140 TaxID=1236970 RepID=W4PZ17_9BACI|nr:hypothetical protein [Halalkalibacter wakoensis]GAE24379.1 hypothetical protein JCM9140_297 [Halalkalibacter wakoensis JCM 9140]
MSEEEICIVHWKVTATFENGDYVLQFGSSESKEQALREMKKEEQLIRQQYRDRVRELDFWNICEVNESKHA